MSYGAKFDKDLRFGEAREEAFVHVMLASRIEHKRDRKAISTGNVAIEFEQRCADGVVRPSGIATTEAGRYALEFAAECWLVVPTERVKALARRAIRCGRVKWIGDEANHRNALVPFAWFGVPPWRATLPPDPTPEQEIAAFMADVQSDLKTEGPLLGRRP